MGFNDILKNSFVQSATESMSIGNAVLALGITCLIAIYLSGDDKESLLQQKL